MCLGLTAVICCSDTKAKANAEKEQAQQSEQWSLLEPPQSDVSDSDSASDASTSCDVDDDVNESDRAASDDDEHCEFTEEKSLAKSETVDSTTESDVLISTSASSKTIPGPSGNYLIHAIVFIFTCIAIFFHIEILKTHV